MITKASTFARTGRSMKNLANTASVFLSGNHPRFVSLRSDQDCSTTNKLGTNNTARQVEASIPLATAIPRERRALAPAPLASTSGSTPRINVNEVIMIGRKRALEAFATASKTEKRRVRENG